MFLLDDAHTLPPLASPFLRVRPVEPANNHPHGGACKAILCSFPIELFTAQIKCRIFSAAFNLGLTIADPTRNMWRALELAHAFTSQHQPGRTAMTRWSVPTLAGAFVVGVVFGGAFTQPRLFASSAAYTS
jgi:hypothetical protein